MKHTDYLMQNGDYGDQVGVITWHVYDDGEVHIYNGGEPVVQIAMPPDKLASLAIDLWRAAAKAAARRG